MSAMTTRAGLALLLSSIVLAACAGILGIKPRDAQRPFEHRQHSLAGIDCLTCHSGITRAGDEGPLHLPDTAKCVGCHMKPHDSRACEQCHGERHNRWSAELARTHLRFAHDRHVAKLSGQCVPCHSAAGDVIQTSMRPPMAQCFSCHEHREQWKTRDCEACHVDLPRELVTPSSHVIHDGNFLREHGVRAAAARELCATCHAEGFCASCHGVTTAVLPWKLSFDRPALSGLHRAGFLSRHAEESRSNPGVCATCHDAERFCRDCHARRGRAAAAGEVLRNPHPAEWVRANGGEHGRAARRDPMSCAACHGGSGEALCVGCHRVGGPGGNPHGRGFTSARDPNRDEPCRQCHLR